MSLDRTLPFALSFWEALDTPTSLGLWLCAKYRDFDSIVDHEIAPDSRLDAEAFYLDYQAVKLMSKYPGFPLKRDPRIAAIQSFLKAEAECERTNERFRRIWSGSEKPDPVVNSVLDRARRYIAQILGDVPSLDRLDFAFGPGASFGVRGDTSVYKKLTSELECTYAMSRILPDFLPEFPGWIEEGTAEVRLVRGSELTFVPKNAKTDRPICIEPVLNGLYQKGVGSYIRARLRRHGVDLRDQTVNQKLARRGVADGLATVDFTSASDTIAYNLVMDLLPFDWFEFLEVARCANYRVQDRWFCFQKFSSMGNAYTFELESLIFYALARASCVEVGASPLDCNVYGDDVVIPQEALYLYCAVTAFCGFTTNSSKTFGSGPFRESCGMDYYLGYLVRPYFLKKDLSTWEDRFYAHNIVVRFQNRLADCCRSTAGPAWRVLARLRRLARNLRNNVPAHRRFVGPEGYGDGWMVVDLDEGLASPFVSRHRYYDAYIVRCVSRRAKTVSLEEAPTSLALYKAYRYPPLGDGREKLDPDTACQQSMSYTLRGHVTEAVQRRLVPTWPLLGTASLLVMPKAP